MKKITLLAVSAAVLIASSCKKHDLDSANGVNDATNGNVSNVNQLKVPADFDYSTTQGVDISVNLNDLNGNPLRGTVVSFYDKTLLEKDAKLLFTGVTDANGRLDARATFPKYLKQIIVRPLRVDIPSDVIVPIVGGRVSYVVTGGKIKTQYINHEQTANTPQGTRKNTQAKLSKKLGTWDSDGKPNYLTTSDNISSAFLNDINASLPESQNVANHHPTYLSSSWDRNIKLTQAADVYVTFVGEGASYQNCMFFYIYNKSNPPSSYSDIDSFYTIFPNASLSGSGGSLTSGNKVKIGHWGADTVVGFAIGANGWDAGNQRPTPGNNFYATDDNLNPESTASLRKHSIIMHSANTGRCVIGFEDLRRDGGSDEDFNDLIFYVATTPSAIDTTNLPPLDTPADCDNDGVSDAFDAYPCDASRAFDNYYPSATTWATSAFEDLWPSKGDYDVNDLVTNYRYHTVLNSQNKVVYMECRLFVPAKGGSLKGGFGVQFPFNASIVQSVTGTSYTRSMISNASNGCENGHTKATVIMFDEATNILHGHGGSMYNTIQGNPPAETDTLNVKITFTSPITTTTLGDYPFNPFLFVGNGRSVEVHVPNSPNTALANTNLFGTYDDNTSIVNNRYYVTKTNLFYALNLPEQFAWPKEKNSVLNAYNHFAEWCQSGGTSHPDWYKNLPGNRNPAYLY